MKIQLLFAFCISAIRVSAQDPLCSTLTPGDTTICPIGFNEIFSENAFCGLNNACCSGYFYCCTQQGQPGAKCRQDQLKSLPGQQQGAKKGQQQGQLEVKCFKNASFEYSGACSAAPATQIVDCGTAEEQWGNANSPNRNVAQAGTCAKQPQQIPWQCNQPGKYLSSTTQGHDCIPCPAGKYRGGYQMETNTAEQCNSCQNSFFQDQDGQASCKLCPAGQLSEEGVAPHWGGGASQCVLPNGQCQSGQFSPTPIFQLHGVD